MNWIKRLFSRSKKQQSKEEEYCLTQINEILDKYCATIPEHDVKFMRDLHSEILNFIGPIKTLKMLKEWQAALPERPKYKMPESNMDVIRDMFPHTNDHGFFPHENF